MTKTLREQLEPLVVHDSSPCERDPLLYSLIDWEGLEALKNDLKVELVKATLGENPFVHRGYVVKCGRRTPEFLYIEGIRAELQLLDDEFPEAPHDC